jgi:hypothetical protein
LDDFLVDDCNRQAKMTEQHITHIKMANGSIAPVEYLTEESQQPEYVRRLAKSAREASRAAINRLMKAGIPAYYMKDGNLVRLNPDGREEIIEENLVK